MKHLKRLALIITLITAIACLSSCQKSDSQKYDEKEKTAEALMLEHKYREAALEMEGIPGDERAVNFAAYCRGLEAGEQGDYDKAVSLFEALGEYRDSSNMAAYYTGRLHESKAEKEAYSRPNELLDAAKIYSEIPAFRDSTSRADACYQKIYSIAVEEAAAKHYENAADIFTSLGDYLDSPSLAKKAEADVLYESGDIVGASNIYNTLERRYQTHEDTYLAQYEKAVQYKNQGQYDEAEAILKTLGTFMDSETLTQDCEYLKASKLLENNEYDAAEEVFAGLYNYRDSSSMVFESRYRKASALYEKREYEKATEILNTIYYFKDSRFQINRIEADKLFNSGDLAGAWLIYQGLDESYHTHAKEYDAYYDTAGELREQGNYDEARKLYLTLGSYRESDQLAVQCQYDKAKQYQEKHYFTEALLIYRDLEDQAGMDECHYQYGLFLLENKEYERASKQFSLCPDYQDSKEQRRRSGLEAMENGSLQDAVTILQEFTEDEETRAALYEIAAAAAERKEYDLAIKAYDCAGDYLNARTERMKSYNLWAEQLFEQCEYDRYIEVISALGESENTTEKIRMAKYAKAKKLMEEEAYGEAEILLISLDGYEDSAALLKDCRYGFAALLYQQRNYQEALNCFEKNQLAGYCEADRMMTDCRYRIGLMNEMAHDFKGAAFLFDACGEYQDSMEHKLNCCYQYAVQLVEAGETEEALQWFITAREHLDTIHQMEKIAESCDDRNQQEAAHIRQLILWIRAENAMDDEKYQLAAECYSQITDVTVSKEREKEAYFRYGEELLNIGEYTKAADLFSAAGDYLNASEKYQSAQKSEGWEALQAGNYEKARACFQEAGDEENVKEAWTAEAEAYLAQGNYERARSCFNEAGNETKIIETWNVEAEAFLEGGNYDKARECFGKTGNMKRINDSWALEADVQLAAGEYEKARQSYANAGLLNQVNEVWNQEGEANLKAGEYEQAKAAFTAAGNQDKYEDAVFEEAKALIREKEYGQAYTLLQEIQDKADAKEILRSEKAFIAFRYTKGDVITLGVYEQDNDTENGKEPIEWIILDIQDNHVLLLSKYGLDCQPYNTKKAQVTWQTCTLRTWLNSEFLDNAFSGAEQGAVLLTEVDNSSRQGNSSWNISGGDYTSDRIFLLSYQETEVYLPEAEERECPVTEYAIAQGAFLKDNTAANHRNCWWWLRSPGHSFTYASRVGTNGNRSEDNVQQGNTCIRPALWLDLVMISR